MRVTGVLVSMERTCPQRRYPNYTQASLFGFSSYDFVEPMEGKRYRLVFVVLQWPHDVVDARDRVKRPAWAKFCQWKTFDDALQVLK